MVLRWFQPWNAMVRGREKFARSMVLLPADEMSAHLRAPLAATDLRNAPGGAVALGGGAKMAKSVLGGFTWAVGASGTTRPPICRVLTGSAV